MKIPFRHQIEAARAFRKFRDANGNVRVLLADEPGAGKSFTSLLYAQRHPELRPVVIVCPASVKYQWRHEVVSGIGERAEILETTKPNSASTVVRCPFIIINYDILHAWLPWLRERAPQLLIGDEVQYVMDGASRRGRAYRKLAHTTPNVIQLSGTPFMNRVAELWHPIHCCRPDLHPSFRRWGFAYCAPKKTFWGWDFSGSSDLPKLHALLQSQCVIRRQRAEYIRNLPQKIRTIIRLELANFAEYQDAQSDFLGWLAKTDPVSLHGAQRAEGLARAGRLKRLAAELKYPAVVEWINNWLVGAEGKLIVFGVHRDFVGKLHATWPKISVLVNGSVTGRKRQLAVEKFQKDPKCRLFIGNIKAAGVGLNLTEASAVAFTELGWQPAEHLQAEDRAFARIGDIHGVDVTYLLARGTIEEHVMRLIRRKRKILDAVLDGGNAADKMNALDEIIRTMRNDT